MRSRVFAYSVAIASVVLAVSCSNDYDQFQFVETPSSGGTSGGSGGSPTGGTAGSGGTLSGGSGGMLSGGSGGVSTGGASGSGGGCTSGEKLCGASCVQMDDPATGCGAASCDPCAIENAEVQCVDVGGAQTCALFKCNTGFEDCNLNLADGCESMLDSSEHCGECGRACDTTNSSAATCSDAKCAHTCSPGFGDCSQPAAPTADDGCETDFSTSNTSCGSCGNSCAAQGAAGGFVCKNALCGCSANAQCVIGNASGAACNTTTGVCSCSGTACMPGEACIKSGPNSVCSCNGQAKCAAGQTCCEQGGCKDLTSDDANCGACGNACPSGMTCTAGACS